MLPPAIFLEANSKVISFQIITHVKNQTINPAHISRSKPSLQIQTINPAHLSRSKPSLQIQTINPAHIFRSKSLILDPNHMSITYFQIQTLSVHRSNPLIYMLRSPAAHHHINFSNIIINKQINKIQTLIIFQFSTAEVSSILTFRNTKATKRIFHQCNSKENG